MNNVNMSGMNNMGGPVGGGGGGNVGGPMMNNGVAGRMPPGSMSSHHGDSQQRAHLNTYIYEYFLKNEMFDCARAMLASKQPINVVDKNTSRRRDDNGNVLGNGVSDDSMDTDSKDSVTLIRNEDLPVPPRNPISEECPDACFLFDWWCLFWDMFNGQHGKSGRENILPFISHTQQQSRIQQERQHAALRSLNPGQQQMQYQHLMMRNQPGGELVRTAIRNNVPKQTPQQMHMMQQKQIQQNGAEMEGNRQRPQSPGSAENAPSPSKRPRLENGPFPQQIPNGRGQPQGIPGQDQLQAFPNGAHPNRGAIKNYQASLSQQQQQQKTQIPGGMAVSASPANQGSPLMMENGTIFDPNYNVPNGGRGGPQPGGAAGPGNHALQDYQMQLMLLEQQNKKRLMIARQEQDNLGGSMRQDGGPGQQYQSASPQARSGASPNPNEMKRGTPQMGGPGSPLPDGQSRGSPAMGFNPGHMNPSTAPAFYNNGEMKGMEGAVLGQAMPGMRPPSSHPTGFNGQPMSAQQMLQARQQAGQFPSFQGGPNGAMMIQQQSQGGGPPPQGMGTPQQRAMPPPQAPAVGNPPNGQSNNRSNTQPSSPQQPAAPPTPSQPNKAAPGKGKKNDEKPRKRPTKKGSIANVNSGATPSADGSAAGASNEGPATTPTPTPVTSMHPTSFKNGQGNQQGGQGGPGAQQGSNNGGMNGQQGQQGNGGQVTAPPLLNAVQSQPLHQSLDPSYSLGEIDISNLGDFGAGFSLSGQGGDVLENFDFDSFLNNEPGENADGGFNFDAPNFSLEGEIGVE